MVLKDYLNNRETNRINIFEYFILKGEGDVKYLKNEINKIIQSNKNLSQFVD